jgi:hypothetical protein
MSLAVAILIVVATTGIAIMAMLWVRRTAPDGSYFNDGDRAAGVFGVLATGFAVLLGFVVFLAFSSYDAARAGAESEARIVAQQVETAQLFPPTVSGELTAELVCYARSVAGVQWDRMQAGTLGEDLNPWATKLFDTLKRAGFRGTGWRYSWLDQDGSGWHPPGLPRSAGRSRGAGVLRAGAQHGRRSGTGSWPGGDRVACSGGRQ